LNFHFYTSVKILRLFISFDTYNKAVGKQGFSLDSLRIKFPNILIIPKEKIMSVAKRPWQLSALKKFG